MRTGLIKRTHAFYKSKISSPRKFGAGWLCFLILLLLAGCNTPKQPESPANITPSAQEETLSDSTPTAEPTATPRPDPLIVWLVTPADANQGILDTFRSALAAQPAGRITLEEKESLTPDQVQSGPNLVIFPNTPENLYEFSQQAPGVQFVAVNLQNPGLPNVWTIGFDPGFEPFLAGFFVGITANDWRGGGLIPNDTPMLGAAFDETFTNGMRFFCGRCQSFGPPYVVFPQNVVLPRESSDADWVSGMDAASGSFVNTWYISEAAMNEDVLQKMIDTQSAVITPSQPANGWGGNWLGSMRIDLEKALTDILNRAENRETAAVVIPDLVIVTGIQQSLFNEGKKQIMEKLYADLLTGLVDPYSPVPPATFQK